MKFVSCVLLGASAVTFAAEPDGPAIYKQRCAICHDKSSETRAPAPTAMKLMSPENIVKALETGLMKDQGAVMTASERRTIAEYLTANAIGSTTITKAGMCADPNEVTSIHSITSCGPA